MADFTLLANWTASSPSCHFWIQNKLSLPWRVSVCVYIYIREVGVAPVGCCTCNFMHACAHMLQHMSYTPVDAWLAGTRRYRREPSWSSSSAGNWPCCILNCSRKHLQTLGHTKKNSKIHKSAVRKYVGQKKSEWGVELDWQTGLKYLNGYWVYCCSNFKTSLFKHHDRCVVDTGSCGNQTWGD